MAFLGLLIALVLFFHFNQRVRHYRRRYHLEDSQAETAVPPPSWHEQWHRVWAEKFERQARRRACQLEEQADKHIAKLNKKARKFGIRIVREGGQAAVDGTQSEDALEREMIRRARRRANAEVGFYMHLLSYLGVMAFLAFINIMTTGYPWFLWPALGWGIGLFAHYMAVFGSRVVRERYFEPAVDREVRRQKVALHTEKQASIDELSATIAHEIRNPIAAAKSLVQQMGEDPLSIENVEYGRVALEELDRVERRISHLLKYAKEEDYTYTPINLATVVDSALTQLRAKLDAARVQVTRKYIAGPTIVADGEKLRQVFVNVFDNATDALDGVAEDRRIEVSIENGGRGATVRVRDNGKGIPADKIDRIFNPFFTTKEKGTGLGMAISKKIVEAHEGSINVVSEEGRGAEFVVNLPLAH
jgi:signal transduction histidine kinase